MVSWPRLLPSVNHPISFNLRGCHGNPSGNLSVTCDERLQSSGDRLPFADRSVDEVQKVGVGVTRVQIGCFTGVNHRSPAHRHKHVERVFFSKRDGFFKTVTHTEGDVNTLWTAFKDFQTFPGHFNDCQNYMLLPELWHESEFKHWPRNQVWIQNQW